MRRMSRVYKNSTHSLASLVIEPDDYIYLRQMKTILDSPPNRGPPQIPTQLSKHIFIGTLKNADDVSLLGALGITHVLNCAGTRKFDLTRSPYSYDSSISDYLMIPAEDRAEYDIMRHFPEAFTFLDRCKKSGGKALVHCNLGINRSGAICAAYLMLDQHIPLIEAISLLKSKRSVVICNKGFRRQLVRFARARGSLDVPQYVPGSCALRFGTDRTNMLSLMDYQDTFRVKYTGEAGSNYKDSYVHGKEKANGFSSPVQSLSNKGIYVSSINYNSQDKSYSKDTNKETHTNYANKRPIATSHYDNEYFMDTIPEDLSRIQNGRREPHKEPTPSAMEEDAASTRSLSLFGSKSKLGFLKSKEKSTSGSTANESLSTTRPLRVYKRSVTDTELYQKPTSMHTYKRADTVATSDLASGLERLTVSDKASSMPTGLSRQNRSSSRISISSSILNRFRSDNSK